MSCISYSSPYIKKISVKPRFMLVLPSSAEMYESMLHTCDLSPEEKSEAWEEYEELCRINREKPGYFDMVISSDSTEAMVPYHLKRAEILA